MYQFEFRTISRKFARSLVTSHGIWDTREAIILRLCDVNGNVGWGEIAPISWFGSETLEQALDFCHQLPPEITATTIFSIPDNLPACQFGFESAFEGLGTGDWGLGTGDKVDSISHSQCPIPNAPFPMPHSQYSALLPAGEAALNQWQTLWREGYRTFKWKIGVDDISQELQIFDLLTQALPNSAKLRLDANGGLNYEQAQLWLETCDHLRKHPQSQVEIEFIEQPLAVTDFFQMVALSQSYDTAIALDESVATLQQLKTCYEQGWRGIFVIKPAIAGYPSRLRKFCQQHEIDAVFSSVFETAIARLAALKLAAELSHKNRAVGFGINHFFTQAEYEPWLQNFFSKTNSP
ncbi:o-succinylbenzoate synthase [Nostoc sp. CMAA1605]|uniref:o-succinylbenzoate synthase n=1 Tax=Nostoc sp. CMAA1605 TaxID=2055159 RepID=UPI001F2535C9|nr:o-succinylbenzoate synthase [Nostoc sp. CMAA1605]MCF4970265.1 o-succinylbenzoate synthase [Nostoc sp. CMAA1605]